MSMSYNCCRTIFPGFVFQDIRCAKPPEEKGIYVIRVVTIGRPIDEIQAQVEQTMRVLNWPLVGNKVLGRVRRLGKIHHCPTIYIGSAGTREQSKHTLQGRYEDFAGRHTAMYPLWALLYFGWELEYGWRIEAHPEIAEVHLKETFKHYLSWLPVTSGQFLNGM